MLLKDFIVSLRKEIDKEEWSEQLLFIPADTTEWTVANTMAVASPLPFIPEAPIPPMTFATHYLTIQHWIISHAFVASVEEWRTIEPYLTPQITISDMEIKQDPTYEEIFKCLKGLKEVSNKALKTLSVEQLKRFALGNVYRQGLINVSARYAIYENTLYTHENCVKEAIYVAKRNI